MPLTDADIKEMAVAATAGQAEQTFKTAVSNFIRQQQTFARHSQTCTEYSQRIWDTIQAVPTIAGDTPDDTVKKQLDSLRRRVIPKLRELHAVTRMLVNDPIFEYLNTTHELRTVREYKPKRLLAAFIESVTGFRDATGDVFKMSEISPRIAEQAVPAFETVVGAMNEMAWKNYLGWFVPAVTIQDVKLGPYFGIVFVGPQQARRGYRYGHPYVFPAAGARLVRYSNHWFWHPHVNQNGNPCCGNMTSTMDTCIKSADYWTAADLLDSILESWNPDSPYCPLGLFEDNAVKMKWICSCGRTAKGSNPRNERTGIIFVSCTSCAADVCSKCIQFCQHCETGALCRSCQMKLLFKAQSNRTARPYGPICPECHEILQADSVHYAPYDTEPIESETTSDVTPAEPDPAPAPAP